MTKLSERSANLQSSNQEEREADLRKQVVTTGQRLASAGMVSFLGVYAPGNISARLPGSERIIVTPSGISKGELRESDLAVVNLSKRNVEGQRKPSSETPMHLAIYKRRGNVNAIIHTHSPWSIAFAVAGKEIPTTTIELSGVVGGSVPVAPYRTSSTEELGTVTAAALRQKSAVLMQNHGLVSVGANLEEALNVSLAVEFTARVTLLSALVGKPKPISKHEVSRIRRSILESYGQR